MRTTERLAKQFGVSTRTMERAGRFYDAVQVLAGANILHEATVMAGKSPLTHQDTVTLAQIAISDINKAKHIFAKIEAGEYRRVKDVPDSGQITRADIEEFIDKELPLLPPTYRRLVKGDTVKAVIASFDKVSQTFFDEYSALQEKLRQAREQA